MWLLALRNLFKERVRLIVSVGGVAFAVVLIVLLRGLFVAYQVKVADHFTRIGADRWVLQEGTADFFHSFSIVPDALRAELAAVDGVATVRPYLARQIGFTLNDEQTLLYVVGFDPTDPATGPARIESGTQQINDAGIVVDRVFARNHGIELGQRLTLNETDLEVVGISSGGDMVMYQFAYVTNKTARTLLAMPDTDNALLLTFAPGADPAAIDAEIQAIAPILSPRSTPEIIDANKEVIDRGFLPVILVLLVIGFLVGVAVVGLTIYSAVLEKRREYGMLKAVGANGSQLARVIGIQALLASVIGFAVGVGLALIGAKMLTAWVPQFITRIRVLDLAWVGLAALGMALFASAIPLIRIARIDPAEVFRA